MDKIVQIELENLHYKLNIPKKKQPGAKKPKKTKPPKIPGQNLVENKDPDFIAKELVEHHILRKEPPVKFEDFLTTENPLREIQESQATRQPDPSLSQLKNAIIEHVAIPLGTGINIEGSNRTFLFYGPSGTGKSMLVNAVVSETNSIFLDISPYNLANVFTSKPEMQKIMYKVFRVAREFQPSVIFFDEAEHFMGKKNLKKLKHFAGKCSKFKKELTNQINKHLRPEDKVVVIGCTSSPQYVNANDAKKFFYKKFYFPFPGYSARRILL